MHGEEISAVGYGEEESLSSTRLEELLPLVGVPHREGDGVDPVLELGGDRRGPQLQLQVKRHFTKRTSLKSGKLRLRNGRYPQS